MALADQMCEEPWIMHRNIFRGKNLGSEFTAEQKAAIRDGSFEDLYVGDYWVDNQHTGGSGKSIIWRIADINYFINDANLDDNANVISQNHIVVIPDSYLYTARMNPNEDSTAVRGGYAGSEMRTNGLNEAKTLYKNFFGTQNVISHIEWLSNSINIGGYAVSHAYINDCEVELLDELMVTGCYTLTNDSHGTTYVHYGNMNANQLSLFSLAPKYIRDSVGAYYYIRNITHDLNGYIFVDNSGAIHGWFGYQTLGVRPYALIG